MAWNTFYNDLLNYIAKRYLGDITHITKMRLLDLSDIDGSKYNYNLGSKDLWYRILNDAQQHGVIIRLLEIILQDLGKPEDEYIKSAIYVLKQNKNIPTVVLQPADWKGNDNSEIIKEKILGRKSTLLPIGFLEAGTEAARAVVRIEIGDDLGTGFIIENNWLLTNNHVIPSREAASHAKVQFMFQYPKGTKADSMRITAIKPEIEILLNPELPGSNDFFTSEEQDWTLIKLKDNYKENIAKYKFLSFSTKPVATGDFVNIIQHPMGGPKQIGIYNNTVMYADDEIVQYMTDTNDGSSGSPVLNSDWEVVAIHHSGGWLQDPGTGEAVRRNQGTNIHQIKAFILNKGL